MIAEVSKLEPANDGVIDMLEGALEAAKLGAVSMVAITVVERDGFPRFFRSKMHNRSLMIGAMARHQYRLQVESDGGE